MEAFFSQYGVWILALIFFIDDLGFAFFPSSSILFLSALFLHDHPGAFSLSTLFFLALFFPLLGNNLLFYFGRHGARKWVDKHGGKIFLPPERILKAERFLKKYGEKVVFLFSLSPGPRQAICLISGSLNMSRLGFFFFNFFGVLFWSSSLIFAGYFWGDSLSQYLKPYWPYIWKAILVYAIFHGAWLFFRGRVKRKQQNISSPDSYEKI